MRNLAVECGGHLTKGAQAVTGPTLPELSAVMFSIKDFRIKYTVRAKLSHPGSMTVNHRLPHATRGGHTSGKI
jgi:hypothetical protein